MCYISGKKKNSRTKKIKYLKILKSLKKKKKLLYGLNRQLERAKRMNLKISGNYPIWGMGIKEKKAKWIGLERSVRQ